MKSSPKTILFSFLVLLSLFAVVIVLGASAWYTHHDSNVAKAPNQKKPKLGIGSRLQLRQFALSHRVDFYPKGKPNGKPYYGSIIRLGDIALSFGIDSTGTWATCMENQNIRLKTMLSIDNAGVYHIYVHPVIVDATGQHVVKEIAFDKHENLYSFAHGDKLAMPFSINCGAPGKSKSARAGKIMENPVDTSGLYVVDINNPCPPCSN